MNRPEIDVKDGWVQTHPEKFEDELYVTTETYNDDSLFRDLARGHIAVYYDAKTVEYAFDGEYTFKYPDRVAEIKGIVESFMEGGE